MTATIANDGPDEPPAGYESDPAPLRSNALIPPHNLEQRFWSKVDQSGGPDACWPWTASITPGGYGQFWWQGRLQHAHRIAYSLARGPIERGHDMDHECHNAAEACPGGPSCAHRRCCNPTHLDPATHAINVKRGRGGRWQAAKTHCPADHPYDEVNTYVYRGRRFCRECQRAAARRLYWAKKGS